MVSLMAMWGAAMKQLYPSQPGKYQWRQSGELELSPLLYSNEKHSTSAKAKWETWFSISNCNEVEPLLPSPPLSSLEQCQRKPDKTGDLNKILNFVTEYPKCPGFNRKSLITPSMRISN